MAICSNKVYHLTRADSKYGCKEGQLNSLNKPFLTITDAIKTISKTQVVNDGHRWVIFLSSCTFTEDIKLKPFIDIYGEDRSGSVIRGKINAKKLYSSSDEVELKQLTIEGYIEKHSIGKGLLNLDGVNITTINNIPFQISAGQIKTNNCLIKQEILTKTKSDISYYLITGSNAVNINVKNCRHELVFASKTYAGQKFSNISFSNSNINSLVSFQSNLYFATFIKHFNSLVIPYSIVNAAGTVQIHGDTLRHDFQQGAGNGATPPTVGQSYDNAFILVYKIAIVTGTLEVDIHTVEVLDLPEVGFNVFTSAHPTNTIKVKTKHIAWHGFREIPEALIVLDNSITVAAVNNQRSMVGNASDSKLFASRLALEVLTISGVLPNGNQPPTANIPDNVGIVNVQQAPVVLLLPYGPNLSIGQQVTFRFEFPGPVIIGTIGDPNNPPPANTIAVLSDNNLPGQYNYIAYNILNIKPPASSLPSNTGIVEGISSVTFSLFGPNVTSKGVTYVWKGISTPAKNNLYGPGNYTIDVPSGASSMFVSAWGGGGAGGKNDLSFSVGVGVSEAAGGGGGSSGAFSLTQATSGFNSITVDVGAGSRRAGTNGNNTTLNFGNFTIIAQGGGAGGNGNINETSPAVGGTGGTVSFLQNQNPISSIPGATVYNGVAGGAAGPIAGSSGYTSRGQSGSTSTTGYSGGAGGLVDDSLIGTVLLSGPGGGAGGFNGQGAGAGSYYLIVPDIWGITNSGYSAISMSGAGGAGEGPKSIANIANGGDGGFTVFFM